MSSARSGQHAPESDPLPARNAFGLIIDRQFGAIFWGKLLSGIGVWIHGVVAAIVVYAATDSALWVGFVSVVQFLPLLLLSPLSGKWADRGVVARQLVLGRALTLAGSGFLAVLCWIAGEPEGYGGAAFVLLGSLITGLGFVVDGPAQQSMIPQIIRPGELGTAMGLNSLPMTLSRVIGPVAGAAITTQFNAAHAFTVAALTHLLFLVLLVFASLPPGVAQREGTDISIRSALRYVRADRSILLLLLVVTAAGFASEPSMTLAPMFANSLGGGASLVGRVTGAFGVGAALGYLLYVLLSRWCSQQRVTHCGLVLMVVGLAGLSVAGTTIAVLGLFALVGTGFMLGLTSATTLIQIRVPALLRGRVMALWFMGFVGSRPLSATLHGWLADAFSLPVPLLVTAVLLAVLSLVFRPKAIEV